MGAGDHCQRRCTSIPEGLWRGYVTDGVGAWELLEAGVRSIWSTSGPSFRTWLIRVLIGSASNTLVPAGISNRLSGCSNHCSTNFRRMRIGIGSWISARCPEAGPARSGWPPSAAPVTAPIVPDRWHQERRPLGKVDKRLFFLYLSYFRRQSRHPKHRLHRW